MIKKVEPKEIIKDFEKLCDRADEIDTIKDNKLIRQIVAELNSTIKANNLVALSAPAIGYNKRLFTINFNGELRTFINPIITQAKGFQLNKEVCECCDGTWLRPRNTDITIMYSNPSGKIQSKQLVGAAATVFQHQLDHLDGILLSDIGLEIDDEFENASEEEQMEVVKFYLESLELAEENLHNEIHNDTELKEVSDAIDFMTKVQSGDVKIEAYQMPNNSNKEIVDNEEGNNTNTD